MRCLLLALLFCYSASAQLFIPYLGGSTGNYLDVDLLAFWEFEEESGDAVDSSGNGRTLTENGTPTSGPGLVGLARGYSTTDHTEYFSRATEEEFAFTNGIFTIAVFVNLDPANYATSDMTIISRGDYSGTNFSWSLQKDYGTPNDSIQFYWSTDGVFNITNVVEFEFDGGVEGGYYFIVVRGDGANVRLSATFYGEDNLASDSVAALGGTIFAGDGTLRVGDLEGSDLHDMGGTIDQLGVWSRYLASCQLKWLYTGRLGAFNAAQFDANTCLDP